ncbi:hypothetical protein GCM10027157_07800 [Corynebacterium aquatimens]
MRSSDALSSVGPGHFAGDLLGRKVFNVPGCVPSPEHPTPVLFVHGTAGNTAMWLPAARALKKRGYCVYGWDYGKLPAREQALFPGFYGLADINDNAKELAANVERVKQMTGAKQVDLVGHSQGGTLTKKYIAQLGGADSVRRVVAAGGSFHGTTMGGMTEVAESKGGQQTRSRVRAGDQQRWNSEHIRELNTFPDTDPRVVYTSIYSPSDGVVTPYSSSMLESVGGADVANVNVEATCGGYVNHIFMPMNRKITAMVVWGLEREVGDHAPKGCRF